MTNKSDKTRIAFVGLYKETNLGDPIIQDCTEWLFEKHFGREFEKKRLYFNYSQKHLTKDFINRQRARFNRYDYNKHLFSATKSYFKRNLIDIDLVVVVGGGIIKFKQQGFPIQLTALLEAANEKSVPVVLNSVGVEGYDETDNRCMTIKKSLQLPCVKYISTRDDKRTLVEGYYDGKPPIPVCNVADPAVWASDVYNIEKKTDCGYIGIGIARGDIFEKYGINISQKEVLELYCSLIEHYIKSGQKVKILTNGGKADNDFAIKVNCALLAKGHMVGCMFPSTPEELLSIIGSFKGIIATRLHSCIVAYALDVPFVGLVWNEKMNLFGNNIYHPEYFIQPDGFNIGNITARLNEAIEIGYNNERKTAFCKTIVERISGLNEIIKL